VQPILPAALFIEFISPLPDLLFKSGMNGCGRESLNTAGAVL
jgi:hypothetical protein